MRQTGAVNQWTRPHGSAHVLVLGAGAIGGLIAAHLSALKGIRVTLGVRRPIPPLRFERSGTFTTPDVRIVNDPAGLSEVDVVVVATKSHQVPGLEFWFRSRSCAESSVIVAQNGVEQVSRLAAYFPEDRIAPMIVTHGAERPVLGVVVQTLDGRTQVPDTAVGREFSELARGSDLKVEVVSDFQTALWTKLVRNLVGNSLTAIADVPVREVGQRVELRELATRMVIECCIVARAAGADLDEAMAVPMLDEIATYAPTVHTSMWQDRRAGRRMEHQAISGAVVRGAEELGMDAPYCRAVTSILETLSRSAGDVESPSGPRTETHGA